MNPSGYVVWPADSFRDVPGPVQTLKLLRTWGSVISIGEERFAPSIRILVVRPFAPSSEGIKTIANITVEAKVFVTIGSGSVQNH